jgi:hypothetical protein
LGVMILHTIARRLERVEEELWRDPKGNGAV